jgi:hypothetical protein
LPGIQNGIVNRAALGIQKGYFQAGEMKRKCASFSPSWKIYLWDQFYERALRLSHLHATIPAAVDRKLKCIPQIYNEHEGVYTRALKGSPGRAPQQQAMAT